MRTGFVAAAVALNIVFVSAIPLLAQTQAAPTDIPSDGSELIERRVSCNDYAGKGRADPSFATAIAPTMAALRCKDVPADEAALKDRYRDQPQILTDLDRKWVKVVRRVPVEPMVQKLGPDD